MNWWHLTRRRVAEWLSPSTVISLKRRPLASRNIRSRQRWSGSGSLTESAVLLVLSAQDMTRREITAAIGTTTAGMILPRMVDRGQIEVIPNTRPYRYRVREAQHTGDA